MNLATSSGGSQQVADQRTERDAAFLGLRFDKSAREVRREPLLTPILAAGVESVRRANDRRMAAASAARAIGSDRSIARGYRLLAPPQKAEASQSDQRDDPGALQRPIPTQEHVYKQDRPGKDQRENGPQLPGEGV